MRFIRLLILTILVSCNSEKQLDIQGHRGCRGLYPENSLPAFKKALELGVHTLELDVVISKDSLVVVSHEPFMNHEIARDAFGNEIDRANENNYNIFLMPYDSIILYDCGSKVIDRFPEQKKEKVRKPLLAEVIDLAEESSNGSIFYNIEIKSKPEYDGIYTPSLDVYVQLVLDGIVSKNIQQRAILQSFDLRALETVKAQKPNIQIALLIDANESIADKLSKLSFSPEIISPYVKLLNQQTISDLQSRGFKVIPWTVNDPTEIERMIKLNVDGIISDYPDRVIEISH